MSDRNPTYVRVDRAAAGKPKRTPATRYVDGLEKDAAEVRGLVWSLYETWTDTPEPGHPVYELARLTGHPDVTAAQESEEGRDGGPAAERAEAQSGLNGPSGSPTPSSGRDLLRDVGRLRGHGWRVVLMPGVVEHWNGPERVVEIRPGSPAAEAETCDCLAAPEFHKYGCAASGVSDTREAGRAEDVQEGDDRSAVVYPTREALQSLADAFVQGVGHRGAKWLSENLRHVAIDSDALRALKYAADNAYSGRWPS